MQLTWERSANATYELLYGDVNRDVTHRSSLPLEGIRSDTTFYLRGTTGDPSNPVVRILSAQVSVIKPDLEVGDLTVHGNLGLAGYSQWIVPRSTTTYTVPCDGLLVVEVDNKDTAKRANLRVLVDQPPPKTRRPHISLLSPGQCHTFTIPLFKGRDIAVALGWNEEVWVSSTQSVDLYWYPYGGSGDLAVKA
ncbi:hypothetical protein AB0K43_02820 [Kitasatospora sp. NPDC049258]|uniref:hypothetical protein n=1 Tax=Kitasatospora sp. NPDC049258 TaxID=3155394 RepID=UPI0034437AD0